MKKIFFLFAILGTAFFQKALAQDSTQQYQLSQLLAHYYGIKDALVASDPAIAAAEAGAFIKTANGIDYKLISEGNINTLLKDATSISTGKNIEKQREHFANLSGNMAGLAKSVKLTNAPVYQAYCPMKKAIWLSNEKGIKNPYYGNQMLTCGKVVETINP